MRSGNVKSQNTTTTTKPPLSTWHNFEAGLFASESDLLFTHFLDTGGKIAQNARVPINNWQAYKNAAYLQSLRKTWDLPSAIQMTQIPKNIPTSIVLKESMNGLGISALNKGVTRTYRFLTQDMFAQYFVPIVKKILGEDNKNAEAIGHGAAGGVSAATETAASYPLDVMKTRSQLGINNYKGLYTGVLGTVGKNTLNAALFFGTHKKLLSMLQKNAKQTNTEGVSSSNAKPTIIQEIAAGAGAAGFSAGVMNPFEVAKTRLQAANKNPEMPKLNYFSMFKQIVAKEGFQALTKGLLFRSIKAPIQVAGPFFAYKMVKNYFEEKEENERNQRGSALAR